MSNKVMLHERYKLNKGNKSEHHLCNVVIFVNGKTILLFLIVAVFVGIVFSYQVATTGDVSSDTFPKMTFMSTLRHLVGAGDRELVGEENDRVNILLMGIGGEGHEGPQLSDTMIFASWQPSTHDIGMISIPRDLTVPIPGYGWRKINHANAFGEMEEDGYGPDLATQVVEQILNQDIQYYVRVDFDGFSQVIDDIGGIDVYVENSFTDTEFPSLGMENADCGETTLINEEGEEEIVENYDCRFEVLTFEEGWIHMDGETALNFVRSRHGTNGESSDFARSRRQQSILLAVKNKVLSVSTLLNPSRISNLLETLKDNIATNLSVWELMRLAGEFKNLDTTNINSHVLDTSENSPLYATSMDGAYVLLPKNDDWSPIQQMAENIFLSETELSVMYEQYQETFEGLTQVEIQNGTNITGLASRTSLLIETSEIRVIKIGNAPTRDYSYTIIYDFTQGDKTNELNALRENLQASLIFSEDGWTVTGEIPTEEIEVFQKTYIDLASQSEVDFLVILGEDSKNLVML
ncbi:MAG: Cell envelope-related transcriptional attenuator [Candidatus Uhrbacteria bacterium GW2011_GWF2_40_263]|nr:MAG: Cell envelope-related transcriptional attenuator [Candidatus Uhrbacteria bacterium GW2011_GWF2_40_263]